VKQISELENLLQTTPIVSLADSDLELLAKLELLNGVGSIKDRPAFGILRGAIARGEIGSETTVVESSSGNFANAMAVFCRLLGLRFVPVIDPHIAKANEAFLRSLCDEVVRVEEPDAAGGYLASRLRRVEELRSSLGETFWPNQYGNRDGMRAHYDWTGGQICDACDRLDYVFIGVSSAGTIAGVSRRVKERFPRARIIAVDAVGSVIFGGAPAKRHIPGIGAGVVPALLSEATIDDVVLVSELETIEGCLELLRKHSLFVGGSSGSAYAAIHKYRARMKTSSGAKPRVLFLCCDRGTAYVDTIYNPAWRAWRRDQSETDSHPWR
jgi:cysteine synthase A